MSSRKSLPGFDFPDNPGKIDDLDFLPGLPGSRKRSDSISDEIAGRLASGSPKKSPNSETPPRDAFWQVHHRFVALFEKRGKVFARFLGDFLDILFTGPLQEKMVQELISERSKKFRKSLNFDPLSPEGALQALPEQAAQRDIKIGGEPRLFPRNYLQRKRYLASMFLETDDYQSFLKLIKCLDEICAKEAPIPTMGCMPPKSHGWRTSLGAIPPCENLTREERKKALEDLMVKLRDEITREDLIFAWSLLAKDEFENLEWAFDKARDLILVRPTFYDDLDFAYREAKNILKLLMTDFKTEFPPLPEKKDAIQDYLSNILEVYTHHHFVLKFYNRTRAAVTRQEVETREKENLARIEALKNEVNRLRDENRAMVLERDVATGQSRALQNEATDLREKLQKLDPVEVQKQIRAMEARMNQTLKEHQATLEEDAELRTGLRQLDSENQTLLQKLRDLNAIPDEQGKSVDGLLMGKRVVIFGGIGRDHYSPLLKEAGVKDADYEWYEGYHTISQARTNDIVGRCDVIVVITSYAGHLHLWQTRNAVTDKQTIFRIHNSGSGSLRLQILEKFKKV